jgi:hypothetical protein
MALRDVASIFFNPDGVFGLSDELVLSVSILALTALITVANRVTQRVSWWLGVRVPRRKILGDTEADARFTLRIIRQIASSTDPKEVRRELKAYAAALSSMSKRLEITRDFFSPKDQGWIVDFITTVHTISAILENDCEREPMILPLTRNTKSFVGLKNESVDTVASNYYTEMFFYLDSLFARYGYEQTRVKSSYEPNYLRFLKEN